MPRAIFAMLLSALLNACYTPDDNVSFSDMPEPTECVEIVDYEECEASGGVCVAIDSDVVLTCVSLERACDFVPQMEHCNG